MREGGQDEGDQQTEPVSISWYNQKKWLTNNLSAGPGLDDGVTSTAWHSIDLPGGNSLNSLFFQGIKIRKQRSTGDLDRKGVIGSHSFRSTGSTSSWMSSESNYAGGHPGSVMSEGSQASFVVEVRICRVTRISDILQWRKARPKIGSILSIFLCSDKIDDWLCCLTGE